MKMTNARFRDERKQGQSKGLFLSVVTHFWLLASTEKCGSNALDNTVKTSSPTLKPPVRVESELLVTAIRVVRSHKSVTQDYSTDMIVRTPMFVLLYLNHVLLIG